MLNENYAGHDSTVKKKKNRTVNDANDEVVRRLPYSQLKAIRNTFILQITTVLMFTKSCALYKHVYDCNHKLTMCLTSFQCWNDCRNLYICEFIRKCVVF